MIDEIRKLLDNPALSALERRHLQSVNESLSQMQEENGQLRSAVTALQQELARLEEQGLAQRQEAEFVEYNRAKFKSEPVTGCFIGPYCRSCLRTMQSLPRRGYWCGSCRSGPGFSKHELSSILAMVNKVYG